MPSTPIRIVARKLDELTGFPNNARTHTPEQIAKIVASILEFGWTNPVLLDGNKGILAGHGRHAAALLIRDDPKAVIPNWSDKTTMPTIDLGHLTDVQKRAYVIADNALAEKAGDWNDELLGLELAELNQMGFDLGKTGFDADELANFLYGSDDPVPPIPGEDKEPEPPAPVTCPECGHSFLP